MRNKPDLSLFGQEDAHEVITGILDVVMEETNVLKKRDGEEDKTFFSQLYEESLNPWTTYVNQILSPVAPLFSFLIKRTSTCSNCSNQVHSQQSYTSLSLPLPIHNVMVISVILYSPIFVNSSLAINPTPRQLILQVRKDIYINNLQTLLSQSDPLHFPSSFYTIPTYHKTYKY